MGGGVHVSLSIATLCVLSLVQVEARLEPRTSSALAHSAHSPLQLHKTCLSIFMICFPHLPTSLEYVLSLYYSSTLSQLNLSISSAYKFNTLNQLKILMALYFSLFYLTF